MTITTFRATLAPGFTTGGFALAVIDNHPRKAAAVSGLAGAALSLAVSVVGGFEGKSNVTYFDIVGVPTYCYGGTGVSAVVGKRYTDQQCSQQLATDLQKHYRGMVACAPAVANIADHQKVAFLSLAYNIGVGGFCHSSIPAKLATGKTGQACAVISLYDHAGGKQVRGLTIRRLAERKLCETP